MGTIQELGHQLMPIIKHHGLERSVFIGERNGEIKIMMKGLHDEAETIKFFERCIKQVKETSENNPNQLKMEFPDG